MAGRRSDGYAAKSCTYRPSRARVRFTGDLAPRRLVSVRRVDRGDGIVQYHRFGLAPQQADLQLVPELGRVNTGLIPTKPVQPAAGLGAMAEAEMGEREQRPVLRLASAALVLDPFRGPTDRLVLPAGAGHAARAC